MYPQCVFVWRNKNDVETLFYLKLWRLPSKISCEFQEHDLRYLVDKIWGGQSILSAWDDLFDLTMVRWNVHEEWSPWNCVLLTKDEASAHEKLVNLEEVIYNILS